MKTREYKTKEKKFDAVMMMRAIRDDLSKEWANNPGQMEKDLKKVREKYRHLFKKK